MDQFKRQLEEEKEEMRKFFEQEKQKMIQDVMSYVTFFPFVFTNFRPAATRKEVAHPEENPYSDKDLSFISRTRDDLKERERGGRRFSRSAGERVMTVEGPRGPGASGGSGGSEGGSDGLPLSNSYHSAGEKFGNRYSSFLILPFSVKAQD